RRAAEQDGAGTAGDGREVLAHLGVEAVLERPGRRGDDAVEAHELVDVDLSHVGPPVRGWRVRAVAVQTLSRPRTHRGAALPSPVRPPRPICPRSPGYTRGWPHSAAR